MIINNGCDDMQLLSLHDCVTSAVTYTDNAFVLIFDRAQLAEDVLDSIEGAPDAQYLKVSYHLSSDACEDAQNLTVKQINRNKRLRKNIFAQHKLGEFLQYLQCNSYNLVIYNHYINSQQCLIICELDGKDGWRLGNEFFIELPIDKVVLSWG